MMNLAGNHPRAGVHQRGRQRSVTGWDRGSPTANRLALKAMNFAHAFIACRRQRPHFGDDPVDLGYW
jgi:hypothetical protein